MPNNKVINVNIIIDTSKLMSDCTNPSKDPNNPTGIGHQYQFMVVSDGASAVQGQGTGDLSFDATQGDVVRFTAISEFNNFNNPVVLYNLFKYGGSDVFAQPHFTLQPFSDVSTVAPSNFNPLRVNTVTQNFWFAQNTVNNKGTENFGLYFAVYNPDLSLFGYFSWDPAITAS